MEGGIYLTTKRRKVMKDNQVQRLYIYIIIIFFLATIYEY